MDTKVLGELPLIPLVSSGGDAGIPIVLGDDSTEAVGVKEAMKGIARQVYESINL